MIHPNKQVQRYMKTNVGGYVDKTVSKPHGLRYDLGETDLTPLILRDILREIDLKGLVKQYPDSSYTKLLSAISKKYNLHKQCITIGTGANEIIERIARTYLDQDDRCVILHPTFFRIEDATLRYTKNVVDIYLKEENGYRIGDDEIERMRNLNKIRLIWICTPNNPTGTITPLSRIKQMAEMHPKTLICVDEVYGEYVKSPSSSTIIKDYKNLIVIRSYSKALGLSGLRVGYGLGNENLMIPLNRMRLEFPVNGLASEIAHSLLENRDYIKGLVDKISSERAWVEDELSKTDGMSYIPSETNIMLIRHKNIDLYKQLLKKGILVTDMNNLKGVEGKKYVRITIKHNHDENVILVNKLKELAENQSC